MPVAGSISTTRFLAYKPFFLFVSVYLLSLPCSQEIFVLILDAPLIHTVCCMVNGFRARPSIALNVHLRV